MSDISKDVQSKGKNPYRWVMLGLCCMFFFVFTGLASSSLAYLMPMIAEDLGFTRAQAGDVQSALALGVIIFVFIGGSLLDKYSVKKVMGAVSLVAAIVIATRGFASNFTFFYIIMIMLGLAQGVYAPGVQKVIAIWFDRTELFKANGMLTAASPIGSIVGLNFAYPLATKFGSWQYPFYIAGALGLITTVLWFIFAKDRLRSEAALTSTANIGDDDNVSIWENTKAILRNRQVWILCAVEFFCLGAIWAGTAFSPTVFQTDPRWMIDPAYAGRITSMANVGTLVGVLTIPRLSDKFGLRKIFVVPGGLIAAVFYIMSYNSFNFNVSLVTMFLAGAATGTIIPAAKNMLMEQPEIGAARAGTALGIISTVQRLGIIVLTMVLGRLFDYTGDGVLSMSIVMGMMILASVLLIFAKETGWKVMKKENLSGS